MLKRRAKQRAVVNDVETKDETGEKSRCGEFLRWVFGKVSAPTNVFEGVFATAGGDGQAKIFYVVGNDPETWRQLAVLSHVKDLTEVEKKGGAICGISFSPDGTKIGTTSDDGTAKTEEA